MELKNKLAVLGASLALALVGAGCSSAPEAEPSAVTEKNAPTAEDGTMTEEGGMVEEGAVGISMKEVSTHDSPGDCWMVVDGKVVDGDKAVGFHAKLKDKFLALCGSDATEAFMTRGKEPANPHPESASDVLEEIYVGDLAE